MNVVLALFLFKYLNIVAAKAKEPKLNSNVIRIVYDDRRRSFSHPGLGSLNVNELPESSPLLPGHSLIRPARTMLKSAVKFPHDDKNLVYGNLDNLGITFDKTNLRTVSTGFRKENNNLETLLKAIKKINDEESNNKSLPLLLLQPKAKSMSESTVGSKLKEITMKATDLLDTQNPVLVKPKRITKSKPFKKNRFKEITIKALDFLDNEVPNESNKKSPPLILVTKPLVANKLKEITMKAMDYLHHQNPKPLMPTKYNSDLSNESKKNNFIIKEAIHLLTKGNPSTKRKKTMKDKIRIKKQKRNEKRSQDLLNIQGQIEFNMKQETLPEKSQKIQDFLNTHIPVMNIKSTKLDTSRERIQKVKEFLNNQIPGGQARLSLDEKTKFIENFLNNRVPMFIKAEAFKKQPKLPPAFSIGQNTISNNEQSSKGHTNVKTGHVSVNHQNKTDEEENNANEILDHYSNEDEEEEEEQDQTLGFWHPDFRRKSKSVKKYRKRDSKYVSKTSGDSDVSASSDYEKNPGNPFTIHRNKYIQNWMWNHYMDGDHMNINPFGPPFASLGPTGADLFFGRKWWYYNQDDYKPMG